MEVMIGVFLSTLMMTAIVQLLGSSVATYRLQLEQAQLEESSRFARDVLTEHITQAGYHPQPWLVAENTPAVSNEAINDISVKGDQIGLQQRSQINCYGSENPVTDDQGEPEFYLLQTRFRVNAGNNLAITCRYGPESASLVTQINNFGLVEGIENMQVLYAEDQDDDTIADRWVRSGLWRNEKNVKAVKIAMLFATRLPFDEATSTNITLLDKNIRPPVDGKLRRVVTLTIAIHGRSLIAATSL